MPRGGGGVLVVEVARGVVLGAFLLELELVLAVAARLQPQVAGEVRPEHGASDVPAA